MSLRRQRLIGALAVMGLIGVVVIPVPATQKALEAATARAVDAPFTSFCSSSGSGDHKCSVSDTAGSGGSTYRLSVGAYSCWKADLSGPQGGETPLPETAQGCVTGYDNLVATFPVLLVLPL